LYKKALISVGAGRRLATAALLVLLSATLPAQAATGSLGISATVVSRSWCRLTSSPSLNFGTIDPTSAANAIATANVTFICLGFGGTTYLLWAGDGNHPAGAGLRRMRHATVTTEYLPYSLSISPAFGNLPGITGQTVTVTGTVAPADFRNARAGSFSDTVVITLDP
jgi:spore coat protein U-like protein